MTRPLVTTVETTADAPQGPAEPTVLVIFNEKSGPSQVADIVAQKHSFAEMEAWQTVDENDRAAYLLVVTCETATADQLFDLIGSRLPDYIQARRFPPSRLADVRRTGTRMH